MGLVKFRTKIVQVFEHNSVDYYKLFLPDGRCVASGSLDHLWNEREYWESVLSMPVQLSLNF